MTGILQVVTGRTAAAVVAFSARLDDTHTGSTASASMNFVNDGSIAVLGSSSSTSGAWFQPVGGLPGANYWIKAVITGAASSTGPASGAVTALSSTVGWAWNQTVVGLKTATAVVSIYADAAGTQLLTSTSVSVSVERA
jgi:hypothetical protein